MFRRGTAPDADRHSANSNLHSDKSFCRQSRGSSIASAEVKKSPPPETDRRGSTVQAWDELPEACLVRIFENVDCDGMFLLMNAGRVCKSWRRAATTLVLGDTAASRPPVPAPPPSGAAPNDNDALTAVYGSAALREAAQRGPGAAVAPAALPCPAPAAGGAPFVSRLAPGSQIMATGGYSDQKGRGGVVTAGAALERPHLPREAQGDTQGVPAVALAVGGGERTGSVTGGRGRPHWQQSRSSARAAVDTEGESGGSVCGDMRRAPATSTPHGIQVTGLQAGLDQIELAPHSAHDGHAGVGGLREEGHVDGPALVGVDRGPSSPPMSVAAVMATGARVDGMEEGQGRTRSGDGDHDVYDENANNRHVGQAGVPRASTTGVVGAGATAAMGHAPQACTSGVHGGDASRRHPGRGSTGRGHGRVRMAHPSASSSLVAQQARERDGLEGRVGSDGFKRARHQAGVGVATEAAELAPEGWGEAQGLPEPCLGGSHPRDNGGADSREERQVQKHPRENGGGGSCGGAQVAEEARLARVLNGRAIDRALSAHVTGDANAGADAATPRGGAAFPAEASSAAPPSLTMVWGGAVVVARTEESYPLEPRVAVVAPLLATATSAPQGLAGGSSVHGHSSAIHNACGHYHLATTHDNNDDAHVHSSNAGGRVDAGARPGGHLSRQGHPSHNPRQGAAGPDKPHDHGNVDGRGSTGPHGVGRRAGPRMGVGEHVVGPAQSGVGGAACTQHPSALPGKSMTLPLGRGGGGGHGSGGGNGSAPLDVNNREWGGASASVLSVVAPGAHSGTEGGLGSGEGGGGGGGVGLDDERDGRAASVPRERHAMSRDPASVGAGREDACMPPYASAPVPGVLPGPRHLRPQGGPTRALFAAGVPASGFARAQAAARRYLSPPRVQLQWGPGAAQGGGSAVRGASHGASAWENANGGLSAPWRPLNLGGCPPVGSSGAVMIAPHGGGPSASAVAAREGQAPLPATVAPATRVSLPYAAAETVPPGAPESSAEGRGSVGEVVDDMRKGDGMQRGYDRRGRGGRGGARVPGSDHQPSARGGAFFAAGQAGWAGHGSHGNRGGVHRGGGLAAVVTGIATVAGASSVVMAGGGGGGPVHSLSRSDQSTGAVAGRDPGEDEADNEGTPREAARQVAPRGGDLHGKPVPAASEGAAQSDVRPTGVAPLGGAAIGGESRSHGVDGLGIHGSRVVQSAHVQDGGARQMFLGSGWREQSVLLEEGEGVGEGGGEEGGVVGGRIMYGDNGFGDNGGGDSNLAQLEEGLGVGGCALYDGGGDSASGGMGEGQGSPVAIGGGEQDGAESRPTGVARGHAWEGVAAVAMAGGRDSAHAVEDGVSLMEGRAVEGRGQNTGSCS
eukprot:jgi/Mesvir1/18113/Mv09410-RA.1